VVACPANAAGAPSCSCSSGYSGSLSFGGSTWSGTCSCLYVPQFADIVSGLLSRQRWWSSHVCLYLGVRRGVVVQHWHASLDWHMFMYVFQLLVSPVLWFLVQRTRPALPRALATTASRRERYRSAPCHSLTPLHVLVSSVFTFLLLNFAVVACPSFAAGGPSCVCSSGHSGTLSFNTGTRAWTGTCSCMFFWFNFTPSGFMPCQRCWSSFLYM